MNTHGTVLNHASAKPTTPDQILQTALAAWRQGNFVAAANQFNDQFTFTDQALGVEFKDKGRLIEFLAKTRELFPDTERKANTIFSSGDRVISEWTLTATKTEPFWGRLVRKVEICVQGISVVQIKNGKISQWSDYYDQLKSRRNGLAAWSPSGLSSDRSGRQNSPHPQGFGRQRHPEPRVINTDGQFVEDAHTVPE
jgi:steroid delta-isomerase-like uncharacterized protein